MLAYDVTATDKKGHVSHLFVDARNDVHSIVRFVKIAKLNGETAKIPPSVWNIVRAFLNVSTDTDRENLRAQDYGMGIYVYVPATDTCEEYGVYFHNKPQNI